MRRFDARQLAELEAKIQNVYGKVAPSVVRVFPSAENDIGFTGVIVSRSGEVLTCAHYDLPPNTVVTVELADGSKVKGTTLGYFKKSPSGYRAHDVGMLRLDVLREWPAAALGRSTDMKHGDHCLALGYPNGHKPGQPPLLRLGRMLGFSPAGKVRTSCRIDGGDSGGPLIDMDGRVVGVASSIASPKWANNQYAPVDDFIKYRKELAGGREIVIEMGNEIRDAKPPTDVWGAFEPGEDVSQAVSLARRSTVEIHGSDKPIALGTIVGEDGWILTKRTEVVGHVRLGCWLTDGRRLEATLISSSAEHDLALLKADATGLPAVDWADTNSLRAGQIIASIGLTPKPLNFGVIGATHSKNPGMQGILPIANWESAPERSGVRITALPEGITEHGGEPALKMNDVITHFDGRPTPTSEELAKLRDEREAGTAGLAGERVKLTLERGGQVFDVSVSLSPARPYFFANLLPLSLRRNGFPNVFSHDGGATSAECGGPVVNRSGKVVGINIARADMVQTFAIPGDVVRGVLAELKGKAGRD